jgi:hypothetical protein
VPITLTLTHSGGAGEEYSANTDNSGYYTVTLALEQPGTYTWRCKNPQTLATAGAATLVSGRNDVEMGILKAGDVNNNNVVNVTDFTLLKATFGKTAGEPGYDARADLNGDHVVNGTDMTMLKANFAQSGAPPIAP